ncbi:hypothetical protein EDC04DRAFT_1459116 [Pisolithus marmoratus]|nr:hypothetical protein EDC04DRAFT_1459116 [Pisolithus marmoratus]
MCAYDPYYANRGWTWTPHPWYSSRWYSRPCYYPQRDRRTFVPPGYYHWPARYFGGYPISRYPHINPVLAEDTTPIQYDVRWAPSHSLWPMMQQLSSTLALSSPSSAIRIISHSFPWTLDIRAPVTCATVFERLYEMLQGSIADSEWGAICEESRCRTIMKAAKVRTGTDNVEKLKKIDWLGDMTAFRGLEKDSEFEKKRLLPGMAPCPETWVVKFRKP